MEKREKQSKETIVQPWGRVLSPSRDIHNNIFELFCRYWRPHQVEEVKGMVPTST